jgi:hypothetical protein
MAGQINRVSTIMRAYEGQEAVLLELLETKAPIKSNADSNRGKADTPMSLRNSPGLNNSGSNLKGQESGGVASGNAPNDGSTVGESSKKLTPQTPVSVLTAPTMAEYPASRISPNTLASPPGGPHSPSVNTIKTGSTNKTDSTTDTKKKKKKGIFSFFKKDKTPSTGQQSAPSVARQEQIEENKQEGTTGEQWDGRSI